MACLAGLGRLQVAVKGEALLAVQVSCGSGLGQAGGPHRPLKQPHQYLSFRRCGAATCRLEHRVRVTGAVLFEGSAD